MLTLNSSLKSLPSSAERIRYSSSRESSGMGKYLLDGEGDLGSRTTVCSPVFRGIYDGQTANTSPRRTLQALEAPAKTSLMAAEISYFCGCTTGMISWVINMLLHKSVSSQDFFFPLSLLLFSFFFLKTQIVSLYDSLHAMKTESALKLWASHRETFQVYKNCEFTIKIKKRNKNKKPDLWHLYWPHHNGTLFFHEAIWNLLVHRGDQSFPVVFKPTAESRGEAEKATGRQRADIWSTEQRC